MPDRSGIIYVDVVPRVDESAVDEVFDKVEEALDKMGEHVGGAFGDKLKNAMDKVREVVEKGDFEEILRDKLGDAVGEDFGKTILDKFRGMLGDEIVDAIGTGDMDKIGDAVGGKIAKSVGDKLRGALGDDIADAIGSRDMDKIADAFGDKFIAPVFDKIDGMMGGVRDKIDGALGGNLNNVINASMATRDALDALRKKDVSGTLDAIRGVSGGEDSELSKLLDAGEFGSELGGIFGAKGAAIGAGLFAGGRGLFDLVRTGGYRKIFEPLLRPEKFDIDKFNEQQQGMLGDGLDGQFLFGPDSQLGLGIPMNRKPPDWLFGDGNAIEAPAMDSTKHAASAAAPTSMSTNEMDVRASTVVVNGAKVSSSSHDDTPMPKSSKPQPLGKFTVDNSTILGAQPSIGGGSGGSGGGDGSFLFGSGFASGGTLPGTAPGHDNLLGISPDGKMFGLESGEGIVNNAAMSRPGVKSLIASLNHGYATGTTSIDPNNQSIPFVPTEHDNTAVKQTQIGSGQGAGVSGGGIIGAAEGAATAAAAAFGFGAGGIAAQMGEQELNLAIKKGTQIGATLAAAPLETAWLGGGMMGAPKVSGPMFGWPGKLLSGLIGQQFDAANIAGTAKPHESREQKDDPTGSVAGDKKQPTGSKDDPVHVKHIGAGQPQQNDPTSHTNFLATTGGKGW